MPPRIPIATYRVQFNKDFGFDAAAALVPYLKGLGISHLYASPFLAARHGSAHGYDIVDHNRFNDELGGAQGFERLSAALREADIGLILDFVPNHMGIGYSDNAWWLDVLEWGQKSPHAASFDIDWHGLAYRRQPGVLVPILGRSYGEVLQAGEIELKYDEASGSFSAWYFEHKLPINPQRYSEILRTLVDAAGARESTISERILALAERYRDPRAPSYKEAPALKRCLAQIDGASAMIGRGLHAYRADTEPGRLALHRLLERQHYQLAYWRVAFSAINYRRFFDINDLAGLRVEHPATFRAMHELVARLIAGEQLHGLRLDHIDGLRDPAQYTRRLQEVARRVHHPMSRGQRFYILIEKILGRGEPLPKMSGIAGTTGYERLNTILHVLLDPEGLPSLERTWRDFTAERDGFEAILMAAKRTVIETMLASELTVLSRALARIAAGHFSTRDFTIDRLRAALQAYVLQFPVYRTYITVSGPSQQDRAVVDATIARARADWRGPDPEIFDFLRDAVTADLAEQEGRSPPRVRDFAMKLQQFTGPVMAKALEDTTFYRFNRLLALNEVGGTPHEPATTLVDFHRTQEVYAKSVPHGLTATATHDTKRGEDARMRVLALSEMPEEWRAAVERWSRLNRPLVHIRSGGRQPSAAHEYMLYQTLIGVWPHTGVNDDLAKRVEAYAIKAAREGKQQTSWTNPNESYEAALSAFVRAILDKDRSFAFIADFSAFAKRTALLGALNSLSQLTLKVFLPGVPDFYQGTELWDLSLVDPDNRRPVDYDARKQVLTSSASWPDLVANWHDGRIKFEVTRRFLEIRVRYAAILRSGSYEPLQIEGPHASNVVAFSRSNGGKKIFVLAGRHFTRLLDHGLAWPNHWQGRALTGECNFRDLLHDNRVINGELQLSRAFAALPVGILVKD